MSVLFGPVIQQGYVVPDIDAGMRHWLARGIGPFYLMPPFAVDVLHYGEPSECRITAAFACTGAQQIELIQPLDGGGPSVYGDYLAAHPAGGLQHVASWCDDIEAKLENLSRQGLDYVLAQRYPNSHAYLDMSRSPGVMIQLLPRQEGALAFFDEIERGAAEWDGRSEPIRDRGVAGYRPLTA